jgi:hypothetical protein
MTYVTGCPEMQCPLLANVSVLWVLRLLPLLKTGRHDIAEILLKVALNTKNQSINQSNFSL